VTDRVPKRAGGYSNSCRQIAVEARRGHIAVVIRQVVTAADDGVFAEFERSMIRQRVNAGLKRAVEAGKMLGRPRISSAIEKRIQAQLRTGKGIIRIARECGVGVGTVQRVKQEMKGPFVDASVAA
jgi:hypothetical protein